MIDKYFYFVFSEDMKLEEVATCAGHPRTEAHTEGKITMVMFNLNYLDKKQIIEHIVLHPTPRLTPKIREAMIVLTNTFF